MEETIEYIDFTPTWGGALAALLLILMDDGPTPEDKAYARGELAKMAHLADLYNAEHKNAGPATS